MGDNIFKWLVFQKVMLVFRAVLETSCFARQVCNAFDVWVCMDRPSCRMLLATAASYDLFPVPQNEAELRETCDMPPASTTVACLFWAPKHWNTPSGWFVKKPCYTIAILSFLLSIIYWQYQFFPGYSRGRIVRGFVFWNNTFHRFLCGMSSGRQKWNLKNAKGFAGLQPSLQVAICFRSPGLSKTNRSG